MKHRVVRVLRCITTRPLARGSFESHVALTFRHHLRVLLHPTNNLKLLTNRGTTQVYLTVIVECQYMNTD